MQGSYGRYAQHLLDEGLILPAAEYHAQGSRTFRLRWVDEEGDWTIQVQLDRSDRAWFRNRYREELSRTPDHNEARQVVVSEFLADEQPYACD
jgi:hypothetical protein